METPADHAGGDENKDYCVHCARLDGSMRSYEEALEGMARFMAGAQGLDDAAAREAARDMMARLPAWKDREGS